MAHAPKVARARPVPSDVTLDAAGLREQFGRVDQDGNGRISRDEWVAWFGPAYAAMRTTNGAQGGTD